MDLNPVAFNFWVMGAAVGFVLGQSHGAAIGLAATTTITFVLSIFQR